MTPRPDARTGRLGRLARGLLAVTLVAAIAATAVTAPAYAAAGPQDHSSNAVVRTASGPVRGTVTESHRTFQGIPYAAPPLGPLRWASPREPTPWSEPRDATRPGSTCPQTGDFIGDQPSDNEDCLYLNVTAPRTAQRRLPVVVWIHGGGFYSGSGGIYGAERLATRGEVVVVTLNYRLGVFGFLAHPALDAGAEMSGNFGLEDQQAALRWVRANAAAFGGDPGNVTVAGESAGGVSGCSHLAAPASAGLFHRVIIQSGPCALITQWPYLAGGNWLPRPRLTAEQDGAALADLLSCTGAAPAVATCLRDKLVPELLVASGGGYNFGPVFGTGVLPVNPAEALATGRFNRVPVLHGTTRDEHRMFQAAVDMFAGRPVPPEAYEPELAAVFGAPAAARVAARYPLRDYGGSASLALATVWTDWSWACRALATDRLLARYVPTYAFEFADRQAPWFAGAPQPSFPTGAYHAGELQYLFSGAYAGTPLAPDQQRLADRMIGYWARFARTGSPNAVGSPVWPRFAGTSGHVQSLAPGAIGRVDLAAEHRCGFWATVSG